MYPTQSSGDSDRSIRRRSFRWLNGRARRVTHDRVGGCGGRTCRYGIQKVQWDKRACSARKNSMDDKQPLKYFNLRVGEELEVDRDAEPDGDADAPDSSCARLPTTTIRQALAWPKLLSCHQRTSLLLHQRRRRD